MCRNSRENSHHRCLRTVGGSYISINCIPWISARTRSAILRISSRPKSPNGITLLHEEDSGGAQAARDVLKAATRICFLGFSYHPMNVDRLNIGGCLDLRTTVIGTARGLLGMEVRQAESRVGQAIGGDIHFREGEDNLDI